MAETEPFAARNDTVSRVRWQRCHLLPEGPQSHVARNWNSERCLGEPELEAEPIGWQPLEPGAYLHVEEDQATEVLVVGGDDVSYGARPESGQKWKDIFAQEVRPQISDADWSRVHFLGNVPYQHFIRLLQLSTVSGVNYPERSTTIILSGAVGR